MPSGAGRVQAWSPGIHAICSYSDTVSICRRIRTMLTKYGCWLAQLYHEDDKQQECRHQCLRSLLWTCVQRCRPAQGVIAALRQDVESCKEQVPSGLMKPSKLGGDVARWI